MKISTEYKEQSTSPAKSVTQKILIGTHHKSGTVWLNTIFRKVSKFCQLNYHAGEQCDLTDDSAVFFQNHSYFDLAQFRGGYRGMHLIRDPRDIIVSGCFYHQRSTEPWLHQKQQLFSGLSYQEKLNSYRNFDDQLLFEMENCGHDTIVDMGNWNYQQKEFIEVKYESLIEDIQLFYFREIFQFLGFPETHLLDLLNIAYKNSLFSGEVNNSTHIRSGKKEQWKRYFKTSHKRKFKQYFADILIELGYENNHDWIEQ